MLSSSDNTLTQVRRLLGISRELADPPNKVELGRAQQSVARILLKGFFDYRWELELEITEEAGCDTAFLLQLRDSSTNGNRPLSWVLAQLSTGIHADYTFRYAIYSLVNEQHIDFHILLVPNELVPLWAWEGTSMKLELEPGAIFDVFPMISLNPSIRTILYGGKRDAATRDHLWLDWSLEEGLKPAAIRDRWNKMSDDERLFAAPSHSDRIGGGSLDKAKALEVVEKALLKARKERAAEDSDPS